MGRIERGKTFGRNGVSDAQAKQHCPNSEPKPKTKRESASRPGNIKTELLPLCAAICIDVGHGEQRQIHIRKDRRPFRYQVWPENGDGSQSERTEGPEDRHQLLLHRKLSFPKEAPVRK